MNTSFSIDIESWTARFLWLLSHWVLLVWRAHSQRSIFLVWRMYWDIAIVLLIWVWICIHYRVFVEHLPVRLIFGETLEVSYLILDFRLNFTQFFGHFLSWKTARSPITVLKSGFSLVFWNYVFPGTLRTHCSIVLEVIRTFIHMSSSYTFCPMTMLAWSMLP